MTPHLPLPRWRPAASTLLGLFFLLLALGAIAILRTRFTAGELAGVPYLARNLSRAVEVVAWLLGAFLFNRVAGFFVWDVLLARMLKVPIPGALRALAAGCIFLGTITCIVGVVFERSVTGFLAALGAGSFALGLALRNLAADIFTGLAVNLDRTFRIGDWIEVNDRAGSTTGRIEEIGWRSTHLHTDDQKMVVIPNSYLGVNRITNISRPSAATRFSITLTLDFSVPVARAKRILFAGLHAAHDVRGFVASREPEVLAAQATDRGLEYHLRYWIEPWTGISPNRARDIVTAHAIEHLRTAGIAPAYEKTDIYHRDMPQRNWEAHTREDQLALLSRLDLFTMLDRAELEGLADAALRRTWRPGQVIFEQGAEGDSLVILTEGLLEVSINTGTNGGRERVGRILPGEFVGEMSLLTGEPRSATVAAVTPCVGYEIDGEALRPLIANRPSIAHRLSEAVAERRLRNSEAVRNVGAAADAEVASFARQILSRMLSFLTPRAMV